MKTLALNLAKTAVKPVVASPVKNLTPKVVPDSEPLKGDSVEVGLGPLSFKAPTKYVEPAVEGISEGLGVATGTVAGAVTTAVSTLAYPATAAAVGVATAGVCLTADVEGKNALVRGAKRVALAATVAPVAAALGPAVLGAAVAVATEEVVSQGAQWGIQNYLIRDAAEQKS